MKISTLPTRFLTIRYQVAFLLIATIIMAIMLYKPIMEFQPVGPKPSIVPLQHNEAVRIDTGFVITDFLKFDMIKNEFVVNAIIWFEYDPKKVTQEKVGAFSFTKGDIIKKSDPVVSKKTDTLERVLYHLRIQFSTILDYKRFPLDDHRLFLNLVNSTVTPQQLVYEVKSTNFLLDPLLYLAGWSIVGHEVQSGYAQVKIGDGAQLQYPKVIFELDISKHDIRQLLLIVLPLLLMFYFCIFAFSIKDIVLALTLVLASVSGLIAYSFVIQTLAPNVGYFMLSDYLFLLFFGGIFFIFLINVLCAATEYAFLSERSLNIIKGLSVPVLYIGLIGLWYYLTNCMY